MKHVLILICCRCSQDANATSLFQKLNCKTIKLVCTTFDPLRKVGQKISLVFVTFSVFCLSWVARKENQQGSHHAPPRFRISRASSNSAARCRASLAARPCAAASAFNASDALRTSSVSTSGPI